MLLLLLLLLLLKLSVVILRCFQRTGDTDIPDDHRLPQTGEKKKEQQQKNKWQLLLFKTLFFSSINSLCSCNRRRILLNF